MFSYKQSVSNTHIMLILAVTSYKWNQTGQLTVFMANLIYWTEWAQNEAVSSCHSDNRGNCIQSHSTALQATAHLDSVQTSLRDLMLAGMIANMPQPEGEMHQTLDGSGWGTHMGWQTHQQAFSCALPQHAVILWSQGGQCHDICLRTSEETWEGTCTASRKYKARIQQSSDIWLLF